MTLTLCWLLGTSVRKTRRFLRTDAPLSLTWLRLRGLKKTFLMERQKNGGFAFLLKARA
jgi:hypothetical protein